GQPPRRLDRIVGDRERERMRLTELAGCRSHQFYLLVEVEARRLAHAATHEHTLHVRREIVEHATEAHEVEASVAERRRYRRHETRDPGPHRHGSGGGRPNGQSLTCGW